MCSAATDGAPAPDDAFRGFVSHDRAEETPEAKARWFQSLPLSERMDLFVAFTNLILTANPNIADLKDARPATGSIRVLRKA